MGAVSVLGEAVDGWDAVETELRAAAGKPVVEEMESVLVATQVSTTAQPTNRPTNWQQTMLLWHMV